MPINPTAMWTTLVQNNPTHQADVLTLTPADQALPAAPQWNSTHIPQPLPIHVSAPQLVPGEGDIVSTILEGYKEQLKQRNTSIPIGKLFPYYSPLKGVSSKVRMYEDKATVQRPYKFCTNDGLVGIEVEVENMPNATNPAYYWTVKGDGSLRNNGVEYVSTPLYPSQIPYAIEMLNECMLKTGKPDFSNRTSTHIHLNCRDLSLDQIWTLVILYCIFEKHFYKVAGTKRLNSIFCVPVYRCNLLHRLHDLVYQQDMNVWSKYCGLNLLPLYQNNVTCTYGTIEFRHLYGTTNPEVLYEWIDYILALRALAKEISKEELMELLKEMNTTSSYKHLYYRFLKDLKPLLETNAEFESCISHVKRELFGNSYAQSIKVSTSSAYWTMCREQGIQG